MGPAHPENMDPVVKAEEKIVTIDAEAQKDKTPPKKYARSQLEIEAYRQRNIQILLTATNCLVACLTCLKVFGIL